jgi:hypothetical protein
MKNEQLSVFILTNGRPDRVYTYDTLKRAGYTGKVFLLVDDLDSTRDQYLERFPGQVVIFDKKHAATLFDAADNFNDMRAIAYARNITFQIAKKLGIKYFIQLDDDYRHFQFRFDRELQYHPRVLKKLDEVFAALLKFYINSGAASLAIAQGGDFIGGEGSPMAKQILLKRKCMNSFICSTERPFKFQGRINEDVNTYTASASRGLLMLTTNQLTLEQMQTQSNAGGMTELYVDSGTYVKSFYSVIFQPSSVKVKVLQSKNSRLHHSVSWKNTVPMILREEIKKDLSTRVERKYD